MTVFASFAILLLVAAVTFILRPLWLGAGRNQADSERKTANLAIFRDQLSDLEREQREGVLSTSDFELARDELKRRLAEEIDSEPVSADQVSKPSRTLALVILLLLPVLASVGYAVLGNPAAIDPAARQARPQMTPDQIAGMVDKLAARLKENPDDMKGWLMLARSYKSMGRSEESAAAYAKAEPLVNESPDLLASYAEVLAISTGKGMKGKPRALVEKALKLDPAHPHSLFLAGAAAMEAGENQKGIGYWESLLPLVDPGSEVEQILRDGIDKMKQRLKK